MQREVKLRSANEVIEAVMKSEIFKRRVGHLVICVRNGSETVDASIKVLEAVFSETSKWSQEILKPREEPPVDEL